VQVRYLQWLETYLSKAVAGITQESPTAVISKPLKELGMDSLMLLDLRNTITRDLMVELSTSVLLDLPTIPEIAGYIQFVVVDEIPTEQQPSTEPDEVSEIEYHPVTRDVLRLLRTEEMGTPSAAHNIGLAAQLVTYTTPEALEDFLTGLANRHAALRMAIVKSTQGGKDYEFEIHRSLEGKLKEPLLRVSRLTENVDIQNESSRRLKALMARPFDFKAAPLWRFELIETPKGEQVLLCGAHHAVSDFQSLLLFMMEFDQALAGR